MIFKFLKHLLYVYVSMNHELVDRVVEAQPGPSESSASDPDCWAISSSPKYDFNGKNKDVFSHSEYINWTSTMCQ